MLIWALDDGGNSDVPDKIGEMATALSVHKKKEGSAAFTVSILTCSDCPMASFLE